MHGAQAPRLGVHHTLGATRGGAIRGALCKSAHDPWEDYVGQCRSRARGRARTDERGVSEAGTAFRSPGRCRGVRFLKMMLGHVHGHCSSEGRHSGQSLCMQTGVHRRRSSAGIQRERGWQASMCGGGDAGAVQNGQAKPVGPLYAEDSMVQAKRRAQVHEIHETHAEPKIRTKATSLSSAQQQSNIGPGAGSCDLQMQPTAS